MRVPAGNWTGFSGSGAVQRRGIENAQRGPDSRGGCSTSPCRTRSPAHCDDEGAPAVFGLDGCEREEDFRRALGGVRRSRATVFWSANLCRRRTSRNQARANAHSVFTVAVDESRAAAVSSTVRPAKYRSMTTCALRLSRRWQLIERVVDRQHVVRVGARCGRLARYIDAMLFAAVLQPMMVPRTLHEEAAHRAAAAAKKCPRPSSGGHSPAASAGGMPRGERGRLEGLRARFPGQAGASQTAQLVVDRGRSSADERAAPSVACLAHRGDCGRGLMGDLRCTPDCAMASARLSTGNPEGRGWQ